MRSEHDRLPSKSGIFNPHSILSRLRARPDREHEMSINRLVFAVLISITIYARSTHTSDIALIAMLAYVCVALGILVQIIAWQQPSNLRRLIALLLDCTFLSWQLHLGGESGAAFFPIYLWVAFGNGFRFGLVWLRLAMVSTFVTFAAVVWSTPFWHDQMHLSAGLLLSLILLPAYAGTLISRLSKARQQAEQANEAKSFFLASVSHELRTPLTAIIGMGGMLRETRLDASQQEMAETVQDAATSLLSLITGILDFARLEAEPSADEPEAFSLPELLRETRNLIAAQAFKKGLPVAIHINARVPPLVVGVKRAISDILTNLLANAVKFTERGAIIIAADCELAEDGKCRLFIRVVDSGIGIATHNQVRIFERFTQADKSISSRFGGTGLGLALARRQAESLGGTLTVNSVEGQGAEFVLTAELELGSQALKAEQPSRTRVIYDLSSSVHDSVFQTLKGIGIGYLDAAATDNLPANNDLSSPTAVSMLADDGELQAFAPSQALLTLHNRHPHLICAAFTTREETKFAHRAWPIDVVLTCEKFSTGIRDALNQVDLLSTGSGPSQPTKASASSAISRHILVADDNLVNRRVLSKILQTAGHRVVEVVDGEGALDALENLHGQFDLVLMDVNMPGMDGLEATKLYRVIALGRPALPIVGLTADASPETAERCLAAGMDCCMAKPVTPGALIALVQTLTATDVESGSTSPTNDFDAERLRDSGRDTLNSQTLQMLAKLGGQTFLHELIEDFLAEANRIIDSASQAALHRQKINFRTAIHALQSSAGNVGAQSLADLCEQWQKFDLVEFNEAAEKIPMRLSAEMARTGAALAKHLHDQTDENGQPVTVLNAGC